MRERLDVERDPPSREGSSQQTVSLITPRLISVEAWQSLKDTYDDSSSVSSKIRIFFALLSFFSPSSFSFPTLSTLSSVFFPFFLFALPSPLFLCQPRRREMKGGEGESFSATLLRSLTREQEKKKKKILAMREILFLPRGKSSKSTTASARRSTAGWKLQLRGEALVEVRCFLEKIGIGKSDTFCLAR